jgi:hypothetical protein
MKSTDFLAEHNPFIAHEADAMHKDQEVQMARADLYNAADYAIKLHKILHGVSDTADMEQWVMEKIAIANENLRAVYEYLNYENQEQEMLPTMALESMDAKYNELLEEDWKSALAGGALAASMALGGGAAHADEAPRDVPAATAQADGGSINSRFTQGIDFSSTPYTINANGKEYKFAGRDAEPPSKGQSVKVPASLIGIRSLKAVNVILAPDGKYYSAPVDEGVMESMSVGGTGASAMATGPVGAAAPMQRRTVKKESTRYANAMKTKKPNLGKGVY